MKRGVFILILLLSACSSGPGASTRPANSLQPYQTSLASPTPSPRAGLVLSVKTPLPSATPFTYTVRSGDTLSQLAQKFNVTLDALMAANPSVDPNAMSVGQTLRIPGPENTSGAGTPTPVALRVDQLACHPTLDRGMWCFLLVHNDSSVVIEDVTAQMTLLDPGGASIASQTATLPLDIILPGSSLPLAAFFPPPVRSDAQAQAQILTAIHIQAGDPRYLPAQLQNTAVQLDASGLSAQVGGAVVLPASSKPAKLIWVTAVAYDDARHVIGVRRWESTAGLAPGSNLPFSFIVSSIAGPITRVDFAVEARP
jgi:LysM repeat protein